jgi:pre-mRNA 3'-end-processing factor FIP1
VRTSTINVNTDPVYPPVGKPISQIDIDADLAESTKPWRLPGADQSDYFNYGFDEFTWEMYRQRQATMASTLATQKAETAQFQQMFGGAASVPSTSPAPPVPGAPTGPAAQQASMANPMAAMMGMPGMPGSQEEMATAMQAVMMQQGITDPSQLDFNTFMASFQQQMAGGGMPGQQAPQQQQQAQAQGYGQSYGNYAQQQGGGQQYGGRGQGGRGGGRRW